MLIATLPKSAMNSRSEDLDAAQAAPSDQKSDCVVTVVGTGRTFQVKRGELLLLGALRQNLNYPHTCRVGSCGRCRTRLLKGRISPQIDFGLSPLSNEELAEGVILACQAKVRTDLEIDVTLLDHEVIAPRSISGVISFWARLPGEVIDMRVHLDEPLQYEAGQYAAIATSGSFVRRTFSMYDAPTPGGNSEVGFLVKRLPGGQFSDWLYKDDRRDVRVWLEAPFGQMGLEDDARDALCIAGGVGLAPVLSIARDRLRRFVDNSVTIIFGVRRSFELFALDKIAEIERESDGRLRVIPILSHEPQQREWGGARGMVTALLNDDLGFEFGAGAAFACGPPPMVTAVERVLLGLGMAPARIHADKFEPHGG